MKEVKIKPIAYIKTDFPSKFGIPRQSGLTNLKAYITFEPEYRDANALTGIENFTHLWLIWHFSLSDNKGGWSPTVRPPRLGGNKRMGVFATRSPYRPNPIGLSCVRLDKVEHTANGPVLTVFGADLVDGTPIFDIKPYIPFADCHTDASQGYTEDTKEYKISVEISDDLLSSFPKEKRDALLEILSEDPRPAYQDDPERIYGFSFAGYEIRFTVRENLLTVTDIIKM